MGEDFTQRSIKEKTLNTLKKEKTQSTLEKEKIQSTSFEMHICWEENYRYKPFWYDNAYKKFKEEHSSKKIDYYDSKEINYFDPIQYLKNTVAELIPQMKDELNKYADNAIEEILVGSIKDGSILAKFTVIWNAANTVKDAYEIIEMIKTIAEWFIAEKLRVKFRYNFRVETNNIDSDEKPSKNALSNKSEETFKIIKKRDGFFYYLLAANIVQAVIIGALVFKAVMKVYFGV